MSGPVNYDDVLEQLRSIGLVVDYIVTGKLRRCKVEGDLERRGWYALHEITLDGGDCVFVGTYGIWHGNENNAIKVTLKRNDLSADQKAAIRARIADDNRRATAARSVELDKAASRAAEMWKKCDPVGESEYLQRKGITAHGVRFTNTGAVVIPMTDVIAKIHGLQFILPKGHPRKAKTGRDKEYWPAGLAKKGHFHLIGGIPQTVLLIAEGYATAASLFAATQLPVAVSFDAGNLLPVAQALQKRFKRVKFLICGDDDYLTEGNPGVSAASAAALAVGGAWIVPAFPTDRGGKKLTDFNDLHMTESLRLVSEQITLRLESLGWNRPPPVLAPAGGAGNASKNALKPMLTVDEAVTRFALIFGGGGTMFDHQEHGLIPKSDVLDICPDHAWREWKTRPDRSVVRLTEVGFDPGCQDNSIKCNLWGGWPTAPRAGTCTALLELLQYLCSYEPNSEHVYQWILRWLAYPIQYPGAKMKTALVLHGPQGAGKNLFFEAVMAIYGEYGRVIDQSAVEDKFNDWASRKLFLIADEVVARMELYHVKNKLKSLITGDWIRINPKNVTAHDERNHVNLCFFSNENQPLILEKDDRRYTVVETPPKLPQAFYAEVAEEIKAGGIAALHDYLLNLDLGEFKPHTLPVMTQAKADLISRSMDSVERFYNAWVGGEIDPLVVVPCKSDSLFDAYRLWCGRCGITKFAPRHIMLADIGKRHDTKKGQCRYYEGVTEKTAIFIFPPKQLETPAGKKQGAWLTEMQGAFADSLALYRGGNANGY